MPEDCQRSHQCDGLGRAKTRWEGNLKKEVRIRKRHENLIIWGGRGDKVGGGGERISRIYAWTAKNVAHSYSSGQDDNGRTVEGFI